MPKFTRFTMGNPALPWKTAVGSLFSPGTAGDLEAMERFYDEINDYLADTVNYPGWIKGFYPVRQTAEEAVAEGSLYVLRTQGDIAGSVILNHVSPEPYHTVHWGAAAAEREVFVIHTFAVHPRYLRGGVGRTLLELGERLARERGMKALRLDVYVKNEPAIRLYESCGYERRAMVDMGYQEFGLDWFYLYEKLL